jgi:hypothetical protein
LAFVRLSIALAVKVLGLTVAKPRMSENSPKPAGALDALVYPAEAS